MAAPDASTPTFSLLSSLRYDNTLLECEENMLGGQRSSFYLLEFHRDRMLAAAQAFNWGPAGLALLSDLAQFRQHCEAAVAQHFADGRAHTPLKLKTLLSPAGELTVEASPVPAASTFFPRQLPDESSHAAWQMRVDAQPTAPSRFTGFKTTARDMYDGARARAGIAGPAAPEEVLLWNPAGELMEGSLTSCYFRRDGRWVTPPLACGGQGGTVRRWLLERGVVAERVVRREEVRVGEWVVVSNGVRGVWGGFVV